MSETSDNIAANVAKAQSTSVDGITVNRRSITEEIEADKYLRSLDAVSSPAANFRNMVCKIVPPGSH